MYIVGRAVHGPTGPMVQTGPKGLGPVIVVKFANGPDRKRTGKLSVRSWRIRFFL